MSRRYGIPLALLALASTAAAENVDEPWSLTLAGVSDFEAAITLQQQSADTIADEYGTKEVHPVLTLSCAARGDGTIAVRVDWQRFVSSFNTEVGFRVDDDKMQWLKMGVDDSNKITTARSAAAAADVIERMRTGKRLTVEVAPYSEPSVSVTFDVSTFAEAFAKFEDSCT